MKSDKPDALVKLSIGGKKFVTTRESLTRRGTNYFTGLLSGKFGVFTMDGDSIFVDRNGDLFQPLLDYLRTGKLTLPLEVSIDSILEEARFYSIDLPEKEIRKNRWDTCYVIGKKVYRGTGATARIEFVLHEETKATPLKVVNYSAEDIQCFKFECIRKIVAEGWEVVYSDDGRQAYSRGKLEYPLPTIPGISFRRPNFVLYDDSGETKKTSDHIWVSELAIEDEFV